MTCDGFVSCPDHGDLYWQQDVTPDMAIAARQVTALRDDVPVPEDHKAMLCPLCARPLRWETRPSVRIINDRRTWGRFVLDGRCWR